MTTGVLLTPPIAQFFDNAGNPAVNGTVLTQVGNVNTATYSDVNLSVPLPNPIPLNSRGEVSGASGVSAQCFLTPNTIYTFTLSDANGNQLWQATYVDGIQVTASYIQSLVYPITAGEIAAGVTPNTSIPYGWITRYGAKCDGTTNDVTAVQNAVLSIPATGGTVYIPGNTLIGSQVEITNKTGVTIQIERGSTVTFTDGAYAGFLFQGGQGHKIIGGFIFGSNRTSTTTITLVKVGAVGNACPLFTMEECNLAYASTCIELANTYETVLRGNAYSNAYCYVNCSALGSSTAIFLTNETFGFANFGTNSDYNVKVKANSVVMTGCYWENISQNQNALHVITGAQQCRLNGGTIVNSGGILVDTSCDLIMNGVFIQDSRDATNLYFLRTSGGTIEMSGCTLTNVSVTASVVGLSISSAIVTVTGNYFNKWATAILSSSNGPIVGNNFANCTTGVNAGNGSTHIINSNNFNSNTTALACGGSSVAVKNYYTSNTTNVTIAGSGVVQEIDIGATASVTDGATITHGHCKTPTSVRATGSVASQFVSVTAIGATTFTVAIKTDSGAAGSSQTIYWDAAG